jgi:hypothetical protein
MALCSDGSCISVSRMPFSFATKISRTLGHQANSLTFPKKSGSNRGAYKREKAEGRSATIQALITHKESPISN